MDRIKTGSTAGKTGALAKIIRKTKRCVNKEEIIDRSID